MLLRELDCLVAASRLADDFEALFFEYLAQVEANDRLVFRDNDGSGQRVSSFIDSCPLLAADCCSHYELAEQLVLNTLQLGNSGTEVVAATDHRLGMPLSVVPVAVCQRRLGDK